MKPPITMRAWCSFCGREVLATRQPGGIWTMELDGQPHDREACQEAVKGRRAA